jgi:cysteate synthase
MKYKLVCAACDFEFDDDGFSLDCPRAHGPSLLTIRYASRTLECDPHATGMYRYQCWLPDANRLANAAASVTYQSQRLSAALGLPNLWIAFSGYWPERGVRLETATFKELEVLGVLSRIPARNSRVLVVASAGNTAAAFARSCSENRVPCLIVVPQSGLQKLRFAGRLKSCVKIISLTGDAGYSDAIAFAERIAREEGFVCEGGVKDVGRRDGLATAMLQAVETIGSLPEYYVQAVGSGAGAIAAHQAAKRLVEDSRFGSALPRLMLAQNAPFAPIHASWLAGGRQLVTLDPAAARTLAQGIVAKVLSNRLPPYSAAGGLFDVLCESQGDVLAIQNEEVMQALTLFEKCEGIDIDPAAGVALAALAKAARSGQIRSKATVLLHITGGGARKRASENALFQAPVDLEISLPELSATAALEKTCGLFAHHSLQV